MAAPVAARMWDTQWRSSTRHMTFEEEEALTNETNLI